jgi:hypothetical protein
MRHTGAIKSSTNDIIAAGKASGLYFFIPKTVYREERIKDPALNPVK